MEVPRFGAYGAIAVCNLQTRRRYDLEPHPPAVTASAVRDHWHCRHASRDSVFFVLLQRISKITVTGALHDGLRPGELHVGTKAFCMGKIRTTCQQESQFRCTDLGFLLTCSADFSHAE